MPAVAVSRLGAPVPPREALDALQKSLTAQGLQ
jgi:hypothetical protein